MAETLSNSISISQQLIDTAQQTNPWLRLPPAMPWADMFSPATFSTPLVKANTNNRIAANLTHFKTNYIILAGLVFIILG